MKRRITAVLGMLFVAAGLAVGQVPRLISYQGILADENGAPKADGEYSFTFSFYKAPVDGEAIWTETKTLSVTKGLFSTMLGDAVTFPDSVTFAEAYWLAVSVESEDLTPRIQLGSVGYALRALRADTAMFVMNAGSVARPITPGVSSDEIQDNAVTGAKIAAGAVTTSHVAADFTAPRADSAQVALKALTVEDGIVTTASLSEAFLAPKADTANVALAALSSAPTGLAGGDLAGSYPDPAIAANAVTGAKIADGTITLDDLASDLVVPKADTANVALAALSAPVAGNAGGDLAGTYPDPSIATGAVTGAKIADGTITADDLASDLVVPKADTANVALAALSAPVSGDAGGDLTGTFPNPSIAVGAVTSAKIADGTITVDDLAEGLSVPKADTATFAIDAGTLGGNQAADFAPAAHVHNLGDLTGTIPQGSIPTPYSNALTLSNASNSFTGSGAGLTNLNASALGSGTVPNARLSGTYSNQLDLSNNENSFTGQYFQMTSIALGVVLVKDVASYDISPGEGTVFLVDPNFEQITINLPQAEELPNGTVYMFQVFGGLDGGEVSIIPKEGDSIVNAPEGTLGVLLPLQLETTLSIHAKLIVYNGDWFFLGNEPGLLIPR